MKLAVKGLVAVAALAISSLASAATGYDWQLKSGTGDFIFTGEALNLLSAGGVRPSAPSNIPLYPGLPDAGQTNKALYVSTTGELRLSLDDATTSGDTVASLQSGHSLLNLRRTSIDIDDNIFSSSVLLTDFDVNVSGSTIYATVYGRDNMTGSVTSRGRLAVFNADASTMTGGTLGDVVVDSVFAGTVNGHASGVMTSFFHVNSTALSVFQDIWQLPTAADDPLNKLMSAAAWGRFTFSGTFTAPVPEPSTWGLVVAGLACVGIAQRRRLKPSPV